MTTYTAEPPYTWVSDTDWSGLDDGARHMDAGLWIRRAMKHIADEQRDPDPWESFQLESAIRAMGEGLYRTAGLHGRAAIAQADERDPSLMVGPQTEIFSLRALEALFSVQANLRPLPHAKS